MPIGLTNVANNDRKISVVKDVHWMYLMENGQSLTLGLEQKIVMLQGNY